jgi:hypothetical protein
MLKVIMLGAILTRRQFELGISLVGVGVEVEAGKDDVQSS